MIFRVNQEVQYIGPDFRSNPIVLLKKLIVPLPGGIYTIRCHAPRSDDDAYLLNEIRNRPVFTDSDGVCETAINARFLRPLVKRKTDISIFTAMLNPSKVRA